MAQARPDIVAAMSLLLTKRQIERILQQTPLGPDRVTVLRRVVNIGLDTLDADRRAWFSSDANSSVADVSDETTSVA